MGFAEILIRNSNRVWCWLFGLVRAFGQLDAGLFFEAGLSFEAGKMPALQELLPFVVRSVESVLLFAIAGFVLDWAIGRSWIKPFEHRRRI
jgi:hypothetical protein